ncbi:MAG: hypothetical protein NC405_09400, partial [Odoribacter sp.]|nr:hypothetical protein [Odoribacter sp.]
MKKFLLSLGFTLITAFIGFAEESSWTVAFKNADNNSSQTQLTTLTLNEFCDEGTNILTVKDGSSLFYTGQYGLRLGQNKKVGTINLGVNTDYQKTPTKVEISYSANKNADKITFTCSINDSQVAKNDLNTTNVTDTYKTITIDNLSEPIQTIGFTGGGSSSTNGFIYIKTIKVYYNEGSVTPSAVATPSIAMVEGDYGFTVE